MLRRRAKKGSFGRLVHSKQHKHYVCICLWGCPSKSRNGLVQRAFAGFEEERGLRLGTADEKRAENHLKSGGGLLLRVTLVARASNKHRWSHLNWPLTLYRFPITGRHLKKTQGAGQEDGPYCST